MPYFALDFVDALNIERCVSAKRGSGIRRNLPDISKRLRGGEFHLEPTLIFVLFTPNGAHLGASVAGNHAEVLILARRRLNARRRIGVPGSVVSQLVSEDF